MMKRLLSLFLIGALALVLPGVLIVPMAIIYAIHFWAWDLLLVAVFIDAYLGTAVSIPYYTLIALLVVVCAEYSKDNLSFFK